MKALLSLISLCISIWSASAQPYFIKFQDFGSSKDYVRDLIPAHDGGYLFTGFMGESNPYFTSQLIVGKINEQGDTLWIKKLDSLQGRSSGNAIAATASGEYIIAGERSNEQAWLVKVNEDGDTVWTREYVTGKFNNVINLQNGGFAMVGQEDAYPSEKGGLLVLADSNGHILHADTVSTFLYYYDLISVVELPSGNLMVAGNTNDQPGIKFGIYVAKYTPDATLIWDTIYPTSYDDRVYSMILDANNELVLAGSTNRNNDLEHLMMKVDTNGTVVWDQVYTSSVTNTLYDVMESSQGGYIAVGSYYDSGGVYGFGLRSMLLRTDAAGNELWLRMYNGYTYPETFGYTGLETANQNILMIGSGYNATFIRTDANGIVGISEIESSKELFTVYPNPTDGQLIIQVGNELVMVRVYTMLGKQLNFQGVFNEGSYILDLSGHPAGTYLIHGRTESEDRTIPITLY